ncbi:MAG: hypothetical protein ACYC7B_00805 [Burkholderiales bacterium]
MQAHKRQRKGARKLRGLARVVLVSWLFTLAVCFYGDLFQTPADPGGNTAVALEHDGYSGHRDAAQDKDVCCNIAQHLPSFFKPGNIGGILQYLMYVLLPSVFVFQTALLIATRTRLFRTAPPGNPFPFLTTNALWPNAPPR